MLRLLRHEAEQALADLDPGEPPAPFAVATGVSAAPMLREIVDMAAARRPGLRGTVYPIVNRFFGETITVSGLVTGGDLMDQLRGKDLGERLLIPSNMLRAGEQVFLDDVTLDQVERTLGVPVTVVGQDGWELVDAICGVQLPPPPAWEREETEYYRYN